MKRIITGIIALTMLLTSFIVPDTVTQAYYGDWSSASELNVGSTASYTVDFEEDNVAKFTITSPGTRFFTFTVVKPFEDSYPNAVTAIYITDVDDSYIAYNTLETSLAPLTVTADLIKNRTYYISVYDESMELTSGQCTVQLRADVHKHSYSVTDFMAARYRENGYYEYTCASCEFVTKKTIQKIKSVKLKNDEYTYNGKYRKPGVIVKDAKGNLLKEGTDYTLKYKANKLAGLAKATVKFKGKYRGNQRRYFYIFPKKHNIKKLKVDKNSVTVNWKKQPKGVDGYEIQYSKTKSFKKKKRVYVKKRKNTSRRLNLDYSTKYYFRVRAYSYDSVHNQRLVSSWSKVKAVKTGKKAVKKTAKSGGKKGSGSSSSGRSGGSSSGGGSYYSGHVYITPTGECYHYSRACAGKNAIETSMENATAYYRPCKKCT